MYIDLPGEIGFTSRLRLVTGLGEELLYIKEKPVCNDGHGCDCKKLHLVTPINTSPEDLINRINYFIAMMLICLKLLSILEFRSTLPSSFITAICR